jgi:probable rRNA maturation factor
VSELTVEIVNLTRLNVDAAAVATLVAGVLDAEGVQTGEIGVRFVGARRMRALNRDYLGHDEVTDVLSFPLEDADDEPGDGAPYDGPDSDEDDEDGGRGDHRGGDDRDAGEHGDPGRDDELELEPEAPRLLGDIVVCPTRAAAQARAAGTPLSFEVAMLLVHGTLHVLGYDHETDAGEMALRQAGYLDDASWERLLGKV